MNYLRYTSVFIAVGLCVAAVVWLARTMFAPGLSGMGSVVLAPALAALIEGQIFARTRKAVPDTAAAWRFAAIATAISLGLTLALVAGALVLRPGLQDVIPATFASSDRWLLLALAAFVVTVILLVSRYFLMLGARNVLRAQGIGGGRR